uniref:Uncharacterized protein n=1 Tax=viral metagenome TaxID=1070528 RepID=A0A6C0IEH6_9ZZZZ
MDESNLKYILKVFIMVLLIFSIILFIKSIGINFNAKEYPKQLLQVVTIEGFDNLNTSLITNKSDAFCKNHIGNSNTLNESCNKLSHKNCNTTSCCILTSNNKCVAGNKDGPIFNTDKKGKTINLDYYYYQNKCYGNKCPSE